MPESSLFSTCPACGEFIRAEVTVCPACKAPLSAAPAAAHPSEGAALCASCLSPIPAGSDLCPACSSRPAAEPALAVPATPAAATPARASGASVAARTPADARCPRCRSSVLPGAQRCPSCHFILVVDVVCEGAVTGDSAQRAAAAFSALGPPAPGMSEVMLAFSSPRPVLASSVSREWAQKAVETLAQHGVTAFASDERLAQQDQPPRSGSSVSNVALIGLVVFLMIAGFFWKRHRDAQKPQGPVHSFAAAADKARAPASPAPAAAPASPQAPAANAANAAGTASAPAAASTSPAPAAAASAIGVLFREELVFGGHTADWWSKTLTELRGASDADRRALYPLARARAERAGLQVIEEDAKVVAAAREEIVVKAHGRRSQP